eukprot:GEMP01092005.1.p1 GENE.GEMP01092005.1~~GEMP01092005.1.p1  ORF type:complete len:200 (+),score=7.67 GEMP01092005.1:146-745(+)
MVLIPLLVSVIVVAQDCVDNDDDLGLQLLSKSTDKITVTLRGHSYREFTLSDPLLTCENLAWGDKLFCEEDIVRTNCHLSCGLCNSCKDSDSALNEVLQTSNLRCKFLGSPNGGQSIGGTTSSQCHDARVRESCPYSCGLCGCKDLPECAAISQRNCETPEHRKLCPKSCGLCWCRDRELLLQAAFRNHIIGAHHRRRF